MTKRREGVGEPADYLNPEAKAIWAYLVEELGESLAPQDRPAFTIMCSAYGIAEAAHKDLHARGPLVPARTKDKSATVVIDGDEVQAMVKNPAAQVARDAENQFLQYAKDFGMTPGARQRMKMETKKRLTDPDAAVID